jgi:hypothetical protein
VFDEASSWWSSQEVVLPDSKELEIKLQEKLGEQPQENEAEPEQVATEEQKAPTDGDATQPNSSETRGRSVSPWRTGVHQETPEELRPSQQEEVQETSEPQLRRSNYKKTSSLIQDGFLTFHLSTSAKR